MNNCLGLRPGGKLGTYLDIKYCIDDRVKRYNRFWWNNKNADEMIDRSGYCDGPCEDVGSNWKQTFDLYIGFIQ